MLKFWTKLASVTVLISADKYRAGFFIKASNIVAKDCRNYYCNRSKNIYWKEFIAVEVITCNAQFWKIRNRDTADSMRFEGFLIIKSTVLADLQFRDIELKIAENL